jgi:hypothetical protein
MLPRNGYLCRRNGHKSLHLVTIQIATLIFAALAIPNGSFVNASQIPTVSCNDGITNGHETDIDCGGPACAPCINGLACDSNNDCDSGLCQDEECLPSECANGIHDRQETDVDCGGPDCGPCSVGDLCSAHSHCQSNYCDLELGRCFLATCGNLVRDGEETDVDCGGPECSPCPDAQLCNENTDCSSGVCDMDVGKCVPITCTDGLRNGQETDTDCGGANCLPCFQGHTCETNQDCVSSYCEPFWHRCAPVECQNKQADRNETDVDCGGLACAPCTEGLNCQTSNDCTSGQCNTDIGKCMPLSCSNALFDANETDIDCGGPLCHACEAGLKCAKSDDCSSGQCDEDLGICLASSCGDGVRNGEETDVDCGGTLCAQCAVGAACSAETDCTTEVCDELKHVCLPIECGDGDVNGAETDVDCGGHTCTPCESGQSCDTADDCRTGLCDVDRGVCLPATCADGMKNVNETDVDCGGPHCSKCANGDQCQVDTDCSSTLCDPEAGVCMSLSCGNGQMDGSETDVDCGGEECAPCDNGSTCEQSSDCTSGSCDSEAGVCLSPRCTDGILNDDEVDVDCGGRSCLPCQDGQHCMSAADCEHGYCNELVEQCMPATCQDKVLSGNETDVDCGGAFCLPCQDGYDCAKHTDCVNGICNESVGKCMPMSCSNNLLDANETDVDCGGNLCHACKQGQRCAKSSDCSSSMCDHELGICLSSSCGDGIKNGEETDVDCGGTLCGQCDVGLACAADNDCATEVCDDVKHVCLHGQCGDGEMNNAETDIDCGGDTCTPCEATQGCEAASDCRSGLCDNEQGICLPETCADGMTNGNETDVDCGGLHCSKCAMGDHCQDDKDCFSKLCDPESEVCIAETCGNGIQDLSETDVDCGGEDCPPCELKNNCTQHDDCVSGLCDADQGVCIGHLCANRMLDPPETSVDCGGDACLPCADSLTCLLNDDCLSEICDPDISRCVPTTCTNSIEDISETGIDCGGPNCRPCAVGLTCTVNRDCSSGHCNSKTGVCMATTCFNARKDGTETDVDCGGDTCDLCGDLLNCADNTDCRSSFCDPNVHRCLAESCHDGKRNNNETDIDCGGGSCSPCTLKLECTSSRDCASEHCNSDRKCAPNHCANRRRDAGETDVDCGGQDGCSKCDVRKSCNDFQDCATGYCSPESGQCLPQDPEERRQFLEPPTCRDGAQNEQETDIDCGGGLCKTCAEGSACNDPSDCMSGLCDEGTCRPYSCSDRKQNGDETAIDCGGQICSSCADLMTCVVNSDCMSQNCDVTSHTCAVATCIDHISNNNESDVDCGGSNCDKCADQRLCAISSDCTSGFCDQRDHACRSPLCNSGNQDNDETDIDCGGSLCSACDTGAICERDVDCLSNLCMENMCYPKTCMDGVLNGDESALDCGGSCLPCTKGQTCGADIDCSSGFCDDRTAAIPVCRPTSCGNGVMGGQETDVDCGGEFFVL